MNIGIILAGGIGSRTGKDIPKQYIEIKGKPLLVYTLEKFQKSPLIDYLEVVCASEYINYVRELGQKYEITKLKWVVKGGDICQESIRNGVFSLEKVCSENDIIMIHMSVSPLISETTIERAIEVCKKKGNSFAVQPCLFCMCKKKNDEWSDENAYKEDYLGLNMPWTFKFGDIDTLYRESVEKNIGMDIKSYTPSLMFEMGKRIYLFEDNEENRLKITTSTDLDLFEAYLLLMERKERND